MAKVNMASYIRTLNNKIQQLEQMVNEMGLDVRASKKNRFPRKTQSLVMPGLNMALCVETIDPLKEGRVRFYHPILHDPDTPVKSLPFARAITPMGGFDDCGLVWVPPAGSTLCMLFENGDRDQPYYIGTMWHRDRGEKGSKFGIPMPEYDNVSSTHRGGYLVGSDNESQVLPPWNTENYNGKDFDSITEFIKDTEEQKRSTYPNIYGFKTPEKHMVKMVDGNAKCNRRWKRLEVMSGCGNWLLFKDDHMHYGGQWAHPSCPPNPGGQDVSICSTNQGDIPYLTDFHGKPIENQDGCQDSILGGRPPNKQGGANPYFKHKNECRPYKGPGTPQNNKCDLPQSGIQILSISGHSIVFDDSVEDPRGKPEWERSLEDFDFGCTDVYKGKFYIKSATGHKIEMNDTEAASNLRGDQNYIELLTATGNQINMNDHTEAGSCYAGKQRGIHLKSTSKHEINLSDWMNEQCGPKRKEGGIPDNNASKAFVNIKSGYGMEIRLQDDVSQKETKNQWLQLLHPQCANSDTDDQCNPRGPHILRLQGKSKGQPGVVYLRAGGHAVRTTYDKDVVLVGDKERNPSDKFTYVSNMTVHATEKTDFRYAKEHIIFGEERVLLLAGRDCSPEPPKKCCAPCVYPVIVGKSPVICPLTGIVHWTETSMSERVFASASNTGDNCQQKGDLPCREDEEEKIDTGSGVVSINPFQDNIQVSK